MVLPLRGVVGVVAAAQVFPEEQLGQLRSFPDIVPSQLTSGSGQLLHRTAMAGISTRHRSRSAMIRPEEDAATRAWWSFSFWSA